MQYFGTAVSSLEVMNCARGRFSTVARVRAELGGRTRYLYVKSYADAGTDRQRHCRYVVTEFERMRMAGEHAVPMADVPRPVACLPNVPAIVTEEAAGIPLDRVLRHVWITAMPRTAARVARALERTGLWIRRFQSAASADPRAARDLRAYLDVRLLRLMANHVRIFTAAHRVAALATFDTLMAQTDRQDLEMHVMHGDLCPSNVLVRPDGVTVLDLAMSSSGPRFHDVAHLSWHIALLGSRHRLRAALQHRLQHHLLTGFQPGLTTAHPAFRVSLLQHAVCWLAGLDTAAAPMLRGHLRLSWFERRLAHAFAIAGVRPVTSFRG